MELIFRATPGTWPAPGVGELYVRSPRAERSDRRDLASQVLARGLEALELGAGEARQVVVSAEPTLDELLAATFAIQLLEGRSLPSGAAAFARYAALVREGLQPGEVPLEGSLEGMFLAVRSSGSGDLTDSATAASFAEGWSRMAAVVLAAAEDGKDPFRTPLFADSPEFARERAFLAQDREVYQQDVLRGERWLVRLPGGPPQASGLLLRRPKSLLFKQWSRRDRDAPAGGMYLLLAVTWGPGNWVFSTDPVQRLSLKPLWERLQQAERDRDPEGAATNPWFDGAPFNHTLVAAPRGGSKLKDEALLGIVRSWASVRPPRRSPVRRGHLLLLAGGPLAVLLAVILFFVTGHRTGDGRGSSAGPGTEARARGAVLDDDDVQDLRSQGIHVPGYALIVCVGKSSYGALPAACKDAAAVYRVLRDRYGFKPENMRFLADEPEKAVDNDGKTPLQAFGKRTRPTRDNVLRALEDLAKETGRYPDGNRTRFVFYYSGHGDQQKIAQRIGYLVLEGYDERKDLPRDERGYDMGHLSRDIQKMIRSSHQLLLVDCCFSGFAARARGALADESRIYQLWRRRAHVIITAGTEGQRTYEEGDHSYFTAALLDALGAEDPPLADSNKDGVITDDELGAFLQKDVRRKFSNNSLPVQTPQHVRGLQGDDVGQFLFIPRKKK